MNIVKYHIYMIMVFVSIIHDIQAQNPDSLQKSLQKPQNKIEIG